jgi:hypothetical protein
MAVFRHEAGAATDAPPKLNLSRVRITMPNTAYFVYYRSAGDDITELGVVYTAQDAWDLVHERCFDSWNDWNNGWNDNTKNDGEKVLPTPHPDKFLRRASGSPWIEDATPTEKFVFYGMPSPFELGDEPCVAREGDGAYYAYYDHRRWIENYDSDSDSGSGSGGGSDTSSDDANNCNTIGTNSKWTDVESDQTGFRVWAAFSVVHGSYDFTDTVFSSLEAAKEAYDGADGKYCYVPYRMHDCGLRNSVYCYSHSCGDITITNVAADLMSQASAMPGRFKGIKQAVDVYDYLYKLDA